ncbi:hypothetical protein HDE_08417 [Halotydeus destructor]|nr:hypothetical protein HDE_08417 [Halotydeus destructor]
MEDFKIRYHRSLEKARVLRNRKSAFELKFDNKAFIQESFAKNDLALKADLTDVSCWTSIASMDEFYLAWGRGNGELLLARFIPQEPSLTFRRTFRDTGLRDMVPYKISHFVDRNYLWLVVAYHPVVLENRGHYVGVYQVNGTSFKQTQLIKEEERIDFDILSLKEKRYMAFSVGSRFSHPSADKVNIFEWKTKAFDEKSERKVPGVRSVSLLRTGGVVYIATAVDAGNSQGFGSVGSPLLQYNPTEPPSLTIHQNVDVSSATKVHHFVIDGNDYLAFSGQAKTAIYWWSGSGFMEYQGLEGSENSRDVSTVHLYDGEILLSVLAGDKIMFYAASTSWNFVKTYEKEFTPQLLNGFSLASLKLVSFGNRFLYSLLSFNGQLPLLNQPNPIWKLKLSPFHNSERNKKPVDPLVKCLIDVNAELEKREKRLRVIAAKADNVWVSDKPQVINAPVVVKGKLIIEGPLSSVNDVLITTDIKNVPQVTNTQIHERLDKLSKTLLFVDREMRNVARYSTIHRTPIRSRVKFMAALKARIARAGHVSDFSVNGVRFRDLLRNTLKKTGQQRVTGRWTFLKDVTSQNLELKGLMNGIRIDDILLKNSPVAQIVTGRYELPNGEFSNLTIPANGLLNGIPMKEFVLSNGPPQEITGTKIFKSVEARKGVNVRGLTNGYDLSSLAKSAVKLNEPGQVISGSLEFEEPIRCKQLVVNGLINGRVNLTKMLHEAVRTDRPEQVITGIKTFTAPVSVSGNVNVLGRINGLKLLDDLVSIDRFQNITGAITFTKPVKFASDVTTLTVNGIDLSEEVIYKDHPREQVITVKKAFLQAVEVRGNIVTEPGSTIDGVNIAQLAKLVHSRDRPIFNSTVVFDDLRVNGGVILGQGINGHNLSNIHNELWLKSKDQVINVPLTINGPVMMDNMKAARINGLSFPQDFVLKSSVKQQVVKGEKIFRGDVYFPNGGFTVDPRVRMNEVNLADFSRNVVRSFPNGTFNHWINGANVFRTLVVKGSLFAKTVNGLNLERDVMTVNKAQVIRGPIVFKAPEIKIDRLRVRGNVTAQTVNGLNLTKWAQEVVVVGSGGVRPIRNKNFVGGIGASNVIVNGKLSGVDLREFKASVVMLNEMNTISGIKNFTGKVRFEGPLEVYMLNGLNITEHAQRVIHRTSSSVVTGVKQILGKVIFNRNVRITGLVNGVNLTDLAWRAVSRNRDNVITGVWTINGNVFAPDLILEPGRRLDGLRLEDLVYVDQDTEIDGTVTFTDDITMEGHLNVIGGVINGCNLNKLQAEAVPLKEPNRRGPVEGRKVFVTLDADGGINVTSTINGIDLVKLQAQFVNIYKNHTILAPVTFTEDVTVDNLILLNFINGVNLTHVLVDAVRKNEPNQVISGEKIFTRGIEVRNGPTLINDEFRVTGLVNRVNLTRLNNTLVTRHTTQVIRGRKTFVSPAGITFNGQVTVDGHIGDGRTMIRVPQDVVLKNSNDILHGSVVFDGAVHIRRNLQVTGPIDGVILSEFDRNRVTLNSDQEILGDYSFVENISIEKLIVHKSINGIPINEFVTKTGNHILAGSYVFSEMDVHGNLTLGPNSRINGILPAVLVRDAMKLDRPNVFNGTTVVRGEVHIGNNGIRVRTINQMDLSKIKFDFEKISAGTMNQLDVFRNMLNDQERRIAYQWDLIKRQTTALDYFDTWVEFPVDKRNPITIERFLVLPLTLFNQSYYNRKLFLPTVESLVYWRITKSSPESPPCREYETVHLSVDKNGVLDETHTITNRTRAFPIYPNPLHHAPTSAFYLWTNTSSCEGQGRETSHIWTMYADLQQAMKLKGSAGPRFENYSPPGNSPYLKDAKFFSDYNEVFIVLAYSYYKPMNTSQTYSLVYRFDGAKQKWLIQQRIETYGAISLDIVMYERKKGSEKEILLAIANRLTLRGTPAPSFVMRWDHLRRNFIMVNMVHTWSPSSVLFIPKLNLPYPQGDGSETLFLVFANEKAKLYAGRCDTEEDAIFNTMSDSYSSFFTQPINVYVYNTETSKFNHIQSISIPGVNTIDTFSLPPSETFLVVGSKLLGRTFILKFRGYNMFQEIQSFATPSVENVKTYWTKSGDLFLAIASSKPGFSKILKAHLSGPVPKLRYTGLSKFSLRSDRFSNVTFTEQL